MMLYNIVLLYLCFHCMLLSGFLAVFTSLCDYLLAYNLKAAPAGESSNRTTHAQTYLPNLLYDQNSMAPN